MGIKGFLGQYDINIDDKGRVRIPARFKSQLDETVVISCGAAAPCISVYSLEQWDRISQQFMELSDFDEDKQNFQRSIYSTANWADFDSAGRLLIPVKYREFAEFTKELMVVGVGDHFEIWDANNWNERNFASLENRRELQKNISKKLQGGKDGI